MDDLDTIRGGIALSLPCDEGGPYVPSRVVVCTSCGADCWRSLSEGDLIERADLSVICTRCMERAYRG